MYTDTEYLRAGAQIAYSPDETIGRVELLAKIARPTDAELSYCAPGTVLMAFYHMAVADRGLVETLAERNLTAIGCEVIQQEDGSLPVLAAISEIAGQMTVPIAAHLLRSSSGGRGIMLGGTPGVPPACVVVLGAGAVGFAAARTAARSGARVIAFDREPRKLRHMMEHAPAVETCLADEDSLAAAVASADVVIGAILVAGMRPPHVVTRAMVEQMKKGSAVIDVAIDQGGCVETSRPTTIAEPTFSYKGVTHFCVPNFTADLGRSASVAVGQAMLPYVLAIAEHGVEAAIEKSPELARGVYTLRGRRS
jgi:alanine dehydrogenase